jgi:flavin-dependent dehydrogenase
VFEKNSQIGSPVQCTGILSDYFLNLMQPKKEFVKNIVTKTRIYAPNGKFVEAKIKKNYVICRKRFDNYLADMAKKAGAKYYLKHNFDPSKEYDVLIGADGPNSTVAKTASLFNNRKFVFGTQLEVKKRNDNVVDFYPYIGCYAWSVPVDKNTVRIGVAAYKNSPKLFKKFAKIYGRYDVIENQSGVIPVFNPKVKTQKDNIYLIGDAATFVKATTGGGINQSLKAAQILADCIENNKNYDKEWRKALYRNLHTHLLLHKMMQKFSDNDWNELIRIFSKQKMKKILYGESRDKIIKMLVKVAVTKPSLFKFMKYFPFKELKYQQLF